MKTKLFKVGGYEYEAVTIAIADIPEDDLVGPEPSKEFVQSVETFGIIYPIIMTTYQDNVYLIDGRRRTKAAKMAGLENINVNMFIDVSPVDQAAWSIILNEQRSLNPVTEYLFYKRLQEESNWEEIAKSYQLNKQHMAKIMTLNNLVSPVFLDAFQSGKIAEQTLFSVAKLGKSRQQYLVSTLEAKDKVTASDIAEARRARDTAILGAEAARFEIKVPTQEVISEQYIVIFQDGNTTILSSFHDALQKKLEVTGAKVYRLIEVA